MYRQGYNNRLTKEDSHKATYDIRQSVCKHGYTVEGVRSILKNRYSEIWTGNYNLLLIGLGIDEGNYRLGCIIYNCCFNSFTKTYRITAFHAHGAQREYGRKGY